MYCNFIIYNILLFKFGVFKKNTLFFCDIFPSAAFAAGIPWGESKMACSTYSGTFPLPFYHRLAEEKISLRGEKMSLVKYPG